jgi:putative phosphoribosyl transferase
MEKDTHQHMPERLVQILTGQVRLEGLLRIPEEARGVVLFAYGSGSSRHSPRNCFIADVLHRARLATLVMDLLTPEEEAIDQQTGQHRFNIGLLSKRLVSIADWLVSAFEAGRLKVGYFGTSTGAAAALVAAAERPDLVSAVVSQGGRPDLARAVLAQVWTPTLLIVGGYDLSALALNREAITHLKGEKQLVIIPGATHLFEEPGALDGVAALARDWFLRHLVRPTRFLAGAEHPLKSL